MPVWSRSLTDLFRFRAENVNTLSPSGSWAGPMSPFLPIDSHSEKHLLYMGSQTVSVSSFVIDSASTSCCSRQSWLNTGSKVEARLRLMPPDIEDAIPFSYPLQHCTIALQNQAHTNVQSNFLLSGNKFSNTCPAITQSTRILTYTNSKFDDNNIQETGGREASSNLNRNFGDNVGIFIDRGLPANQLWWKGILSGCFFLQIC